MKVLFIGDIVGRAGRVAVKALLCSLSERHKIDFVIANGENAAGGFGITESVGSELFGLGIHVITSGNHIWDKKEALHYIAKENRVLRPLNYPPGIPGYGSVVLNSGKAKVAVMNVSGRVFMSNMDCPFRTSEEEIKRLREMTNIIIVDFHAEATSEKMAYGYFADGKVSAVIGTHTHVQTADEKILPNGTAYITDAGMTGPSDSIIGVEKEQVIERFLFQMPMRFEVAKGPAIFSGVIVEIDEGTGRASAIQRVQMTHP
ncbi:MAG: TIGR00282 family metallophosphoesterase [Thermodesulfovibrionales bacterium]|nr:TIGR00282 family metallophosphoesterase [Thermodesulfovibrionales bacterium]